MKRQQRVSSGVSIAIRRSASFQSKSRISYQHPLRPECYSFPCVTLFILGLFHLFCAFHILSLAAWLEVTHFTLFRSISRNSNLMGLLSSFLSSAKNLLASSYELITPEGRLNCSSQAVLTTSTNMKQTHSHLDLGLLRRCSPSWLSRLMKLHLPCSCFLTVVKETKWLDYSLSTRAF